MKRLICVFLCLFTISVSQAYAMDVTFDRDTHKVTISGTAKSNESIAIVITDASELRNAAASDIIGFYQVNADSEGKYNISIGATISEGTYNFFASGINTKDSAREELYKKADLESALTTLSDAAALGETKVSEVLQNDMNV